jgi:hypothetical protein
MALMFSLISVIKELQNQEFSREMLGIVIAEMFWWELFMFLRNVGCCACPHILIILWVPAWRVQICWHIQITLSFCSSANNIITERKRNLASGRRVPKTVRYVLPWKNSKKNGGKTRLFS